MVGRRDYRGEAVAAARSVLVELTHLLGEYRNQIVLVGGWVPELLLEAAKEKHVGSLDVDLAIDHRNLPQEVYKTIEDILLTRGYTRGREPFMFHRRVGGILVQVDFLSGEYGGTGKGDASEGSGGQGEESAGLRSRLRAQYRCRDRR
ncbi:MAG: hypothetical protein ACRD1Z_19055 [Vicinamibacteria bacterium]